MVMSSVEKNHKGRDGARERMYDYVGFLFYIGRPIKKCHRVNDWKKNVLLIIQMSKSIKIKVLASLISGEGFF